MIQLNKMFWTISKLLAVNITLLLSFNLFAKAPALQGLTTISEKAPKELELLTMHLVKYVKTSQDVDKVIGYCNLINQDLQKTPKKNVFFMLKSEVYRGILRNQFLKKENTIQVSNSILLSIEQKLNKYDIVYSDFSKWIITSILEDISTFRKDGFIDQYQRINRSDFEQQKRYNKLKKTLSYISPWIEKIEKLTPESFNNLVKDVGIDILWYISSRTYYFGTFSSKYKQSINSNIFNIPKIQNNAPNQTTPNTMDAEFKKRTNDTIEILEKIEVDDMSPASNQIDQIDTEKKNTWYPK